ncbi:hypothetical protein ACW5XW_24190 [Aeromonas piscicola]|uniref:hypothetical protein n=1 Tax=Aeromonas piscicola TaxID=600645 RepID=UPI0005B33719|nr:hypothetical protein [Aeromonas piscicola]
MALTDATVANYMTVKMDTVEITDIEQTSGGGINTNIIEFFNFNKRFSRKMTGSSSVDAYELVCTFIPGSPSYKALKAAADDQAKHEFTIIYHDGPKKTGGYQVKFSAFIGSKSISSEFDTQRTVSYQITVDGEPVESDVTGA